MEILDPVLTGLGQVFSWPAIGYLALGIFLGIWLGALPGIGGVTGLILLLPFTYTMEPVAAFALMLGMFAVTTTSDTIASVMLGIPGTVASQATVLDGYPLAQRGEADRALGAAYTCSAIGGIVGAIVLAVSMPLIRPILTTFSTPEYFMLALLGICMVGTLSGTSMAKGLVVGALGMMLGTIGEGTFNGVPRYDFGLEYLLNTPPLVAVVLGLFAIPEMLELATKSTSISRVPKDQSAGGGMARGIRDVFRYWWLTLRSSALGTYIGMLPGLGASIVDWAAYGFAVQTTKGKHTFGRGDIRGVIAPESANNAQRGGSLIPTLAFGIPGDFAMSILLGAMMIQGLRPGMEMLTTNLPLTFSMIWTLIIANIASALLLMVIGRQVARAVFVDGHLLVPVVILFVFMGSWLGANSMGDLILMLTMGALGVVMKRSGWPRPPLIIALVLGPNMENSLVIANRIYGTFGFLDRPASMVIGALIVLTLGLTAFGLVKVRRKPPAAIDDVERRLSIEGAEKNAILAILLALTLGVIFAVALLLSLNFHPTNRLYPLLTSGVALLLLVAVIASEARAARAEIRALGARAASAAAFRAAELRPAAVFLGWMALTVLGCWLIGLKAAIAAMMAAYVLVWGKRPWWLALAYGVGGALFIHLFYDVTMNIFLQRPIITELWAGS
ncbi:MAG: tripartite tricarboxylate transporter permease [Pseudomonadota bacterium]